MQNKAINYFKGDYNCAQSILGTYAEQYNLPKNTAFSLANGFGAGMAYQGKTCGALVGAYMVIGLEAGKRYDSIEEAKEWSKNQIQAFNKALLVHFPSTECNELIGFDVSDEYGLNKAFETGVFDKVCPKIIDFSVNYIENLRKA